MSVEMFDANPFFWIKEKSKLVTQNWFQND